MPFSVFILSRLPINITFKSKCPVLILLSFIEFDFKHIFRNQISCNFLLNMTSHNNDDDDYVYYGQDILAEEVSDEIQEVSDDCD